MDIDVVVEPAGVESRAVVRRLMELYLYDFTEFLPHDVDERGEFGYPYLDHYWAPEEGETRIPFLLRANGKLAGFAFVRRKGDGPWMMAEFFVLRKYRRRGVGAVAARTLFARFPGEWKVSQVKENSPAQAFWRRLIGDVTAGQFVEEASEDGVTQRFTSAG